jgi:hypothetical protein
VPLSVREPMATSQARAPSWLREGWRKVWKDERWALLSDRHEPGPHHSPQRLDVLVGQWPPTTALPSHGARSARLNVLAATTLGRACETGKPSRCSRARPTSCEQVPRVPDSKARQQCLARRHSGDDARPADCKFPWHLMGRRVRWLRCRSSDPPIWRGTRPSDSTTRVGTTLLGSLATSAGCWSQLAPQALASGLAPSVICEAGEP